jgi:hypothetical protein
MIPKFNKKKLSKRQRLVLCSEEYREWFSNLTPLDDTITDYQKEKKIDNKLYLFAKQLMES